MCKNWWKGEQMVTSFLFQCISTFGMFHNNKCISKFSKTHTYLHFKMFPECITFSKNGQTKTKVEHELQN